MATLLKVECCENKHLKYIKHLLRNKVIQLEHSLPTPWITDMSNALITNWPHQDIIQPNTISDRYYTICKFSQWLYFPII